MTLGQLSLGVHWAMVPGLSQPLQSRDNEICACPSPLVSYLHMTSMHPSASLKSFVGHLCDQVLCAQSVAGAVRPCCPGSVDIKPVRLQQSCVVFRVCLLLGEWDLWMQNCTESDWARSCLCPLVLSAAQGSGPLGSSARASQCGYHGRTSDVRFLRGAETTSCCVFLKDVFV